MDKIVKGYKVFNSNWTCRDKQYTCPGTFEENVSLDICYQGMHFCRKAIDCFCYYTFDPSNHVAEVIAYGNIKERDNKCCTDKLKIVRELSWHEVLDVVNIGKNCTGMKNTGDRNSGNHNVGNWNSGSCNTGNQNSGNWNTGDLNSGSWNTGDLNIGAANSGSRNSGNWNTGRHNSGDKNTGNRNSGCGNSGNWNSGNWNAGDWNKTNYSSGCFNTIELRITFFNKESSWTYGDWLASDAKSLLDKIPTENFGWVNFENMTKEKKEANPKAETTDGYLKVIKPKVSVQEWWENLYPTDKDAILGIPNFNRKIFKEITGIDVGEIESYNAKKE